MQVPRLPRVDCTYYHHLNTPSVVVALPSKVGVPCKNSEGSPLQCSDRVRIYYYQAITIISKVIKLNHNGSETINSKGMHFFHPSIFVQHFLIVASTVVYCYI